MICIDIKLWEGQTDCERPILKTYILDGDMKRRTVLILPGGGYGGTSPRAAEPVALKFASAGFNAFILHYRVARANRFPDALLDVSRAMCLIRKNADEWKVDSEKIAVCGFSAGGHLAACLGVHWDKEYLEVPGVSIGMNRPNGLILAYPVITTGEFAHRGSFINLIGPGFERGEPEAMALTADMSLENHVSDSTPPAFIWHTFSDPAVPVENSLLFAAALRKNSIPFELHIYPEGNHGYSLAIEETQDAGLPPDPHIATWMNLCIEWLEKL